MKAVIMESLGVSPEVLQRHRERFEARGIAFSEFERTADPEQMIAEARDADVMIVANMPVPEAVVRACGHLKFIDVAFTGSSSTWPSPAWIIFLWPPPGRWALR